MTVIAQKLIVFHECTSRVFIDDKASAMATDMKALAKALFVQTDFQK